MMVGLFLPLQVVLDGFEERPEALAINGLLSLQSARVLFLQEDVQATNSTSVHLQEQYRCTR